MKNFPYVPLASLMLGLLAGMALEKSLQRVWPVETAAEVDQIEREHEKWKREHAERMAQIDRDAVEKQKKAEDEQAAMSKQCLSTSGASIIVTPFGATACLLPAGMASLK